TWSSLERLETQSAFGPLKRPLRGEEKIANLPEGLRVSLSKAAELITTDERRGIDKIAARVDVGLQFMTAVGHLQSVIAANAGLDARARYRVGILTGATVIDDKTGERKGGDNDGPPGAAIL